MPREGVATVEAIVAAIFGGLILPLWFFLGSAILAALVAFFVAKSGREAQFAEWDLEATLTAPAAFPTPTLKAIIAGLAAPLVAYALLGVLSFVTVNWVTLGMLFMSGIWFFGGGLIGGLVGAIGGVKRADASFGN